MQQHQARYDTTHFWNIYENRSWKLNLPSYQAQRVVKQLQRCALPGTWYILRAMTTAKITWCLLPIAHSVCISYPVQYVAARRANINAEDEATICPELLILCPVVCPVVSLLLNAASLPVCLSVCLSTRSRDPERFSPALRHGYRGWATQPAEHRVSCRAKPWPLRAGYCRQSQAVRGHSASIASGFTIQTESRTLLADFNSTRWPIHARSCCFFLEGTARGIFQPYSQHGPAPPGEARVPFPDQNPSFHVQLQQNGGENGGPPDR